MIKVIQIDLSEIYFRELKQNNYAKYQYTTSAFRR
jgi:hypothetical protein